MSKRSLTPEWVDYQGISRVKPTEKEAAEWAPRQHTLTIEDIDIVKPNLQMHCRGKVAPVSTEKIDAWLRKHKRTHPRVMKCLSHPGPGVRHLNAEDKTNQLTEKEKLMHRMAKSMIKELGMEETMKKVKPLTTPINPLTGKEYDDPQKEFGHNSAWSTTKRWSPPRGDKVLRCLPTEACATDAEYDECLLELLELIPRLHVGGRLVDL